MSRHHSVKIVTIAPNDYEIVVNGVIVSEADTLLLAEREKRRVEAIIQQRTTR